MRVKRSHAPKAPGRKSEHQSGTLVPPLGALPHPSQGPSPEVIQQPRLPACGQQGMGEPAGWRMTRPLALGGKSEKRSPSGLPPSRLWHLSLNTLPPEPSGQGVMGECLGPRRVSGCGSTGSWQQGLSPSPLFLNARPQATFPGPPHLPGDHMTFTWKASRYTKRGRQAGEGRAGRDGPHPERNLGGASITPPATSPTAAWWQDEALTQMRAGPGRKVAESQDCPTPPRPVLCVSTPKPLTLHPTSLLLPASGSC